MPVCYSNTLLTATDFNATNEVVVYPNPSAETITINTTHSIETVTVFSMDGKQVATYKNPLTTNQFSVNVQNYLVGIYNLHIKTTNGNFSKKVIIRR